MDYSSQWVRVAVPQAVTGHFQGKPWRLDLYANTTAHDRCRPVLLADCYTAKDKPRLVTCYSNSHMLLLMEISSCHTGTLLVSRETAGVLPAVHDKRE